jgi:hypothetical protein
MPSHDIKFGVDMLRILVSSSSETKNSQRYSTYIVTPFLEHLPLQGGGTAVAQLVKALHYKLEGRGFDFPMMALKLFIAIILPAAP